MRLFIRVINIGVILGGGILLGGLFFQNRIISDYAAAAKAKETALDAVARNRFDNCMMPKKDGQPTVFDETFVYRVQGIPYNGAICGIDWRTAVVKNGKVDPSTIAVVRDPKAYAADKASRSIATLAAGGQLPGAETTLVGGGFLSGEPDPNPSPSPTVSPTPGVNVSVNPDGTITKPVDVLPTQPTVLHGGVSK